MRTAEKILQGVEADLTHAQASARLLKSQLGDSYDALAELDAKRRALQRELEATKAALVLERKMRLNQHELRVAAEHKLELAQLEVARVAALATDVHVERDGVRKVNKVLTSEVKRLREEVAKVGDKAQAALELAKVRAQEKEELEAKNRELERYCRLLEKTQSLICQEKIKWERVDAEREFEIAGLREAASTRLAEANLRCLELMTKLGSSAY